MTYPFTLQPDATVGSTTGLGETLALTAHYQAAPAAPVTTAVHAAVTDTGSEQTITTGITNPDVPRNITATSAGTEADIGAIQVTVTGTNIAGDTITETLPIFTANSATTVVGSKAFATVTSITIPAHDDTAATTAIGTGAKLGLVHRLATNTIIPGMSIFDGTRESTDPTVAVSASAVESNTIAFDTTLDGSTVDAYYLVDPGT